MYNFSLVIVGAGFGFRGGRNAVEHRVREGIGGTATPYPHSVYSRRKLQPQPLSRSSSYHEVVQIVYAQFLLKMSWVAKIDGFSAHALTSRCDYRFAVSTPPGVFLRMKNRPRVLLVISSRRSNPPSERVRFTVPFQRNN